MFRTYKCATQETISIEIQPGSKKMQIILLTCIYNLENYFLHNLQLQTTNYKLQTYFHLRIILMKIWYRFNAFIEINEIIFFVGAVQVIAV